MKTAALVLALALAAGPAVAQSTNGGAATPGSGPGGSGTTSQGSSTEMKAQPNGASSNALGTGAANGVSGQQNGSVPQPAQQGGLPPGGNKPAQ